jgi:hypothetical protein
MERIDIVPVMECPKCKTRLRDEPIYEGLTGRRRETRRQRDPDSILAACALVRLPAELILFIGGLSSYVADRRRTSGERVC